MTPHNVWAIIPAYNEGKRIGQVISRTRKIVKNVVVVDDGSSDSTSAIAKKSGAIVLVHPLNLGKGAALKTGCDYAIDNGAKVLVVLDADAQHKPEDIPRFITAMKNADMVFGCRGLNKKMPGILRFGNWGISKLTKILYGVDIADTQTGFRAFTADAYRKIRWQSSDYSMESEMISLVGKHKLKYAKITIETLYPDRYKGTTVLDGVKIVLNLIRWKIMRKDGSVWF
jgi:glycosyltransferase involved in cell wall biosynthesis